MNPDLLKALIAAVPVILSPIIAWVLSRSGLPSEEARINYLIKRLDLIFRLHQMQSELKDDRLNEMFNVELEMCKRQMASQSQYDISVHKYDVGSGPKSWPGKFFLYAPSKTTRQRVFKGLFYFFFAFFVIGLPTPFILKASGGQQDWYFGIIGAFFYLLLALWFRALAKPKIKT